MIKKQQYAELTIGKCWPINGGDYFDYGHWVGPYSVRRSALATKTLDHLVTQICCTLRFWLHYISTRIKILSLGLMNIHPMKYCSGNVPTQPNLSWLLENAKKKPFQCIFDLQSRGQGPKKYENCRTNMSPPFNKYQDSHSYTVIQIHWQHIFLQST